MKKTLLALLLICFAAFARAQCPPTGQLNQPAKWKFLYTQCFEDTLVMNYLTAGRVGYFDANKNLTTISFAALMDSLGVEPTDSAIFATRRWVDSLVLANAAPTYPDSSVLFVGSDGRPTTDSADFVWTGSGLRILNTSIPNTAVGALVITGSTASQTRISQSVASSSASGFPTYQFYRARGVVATPTVPNLNTVLGEINFGGHNGTSYSGSTTRIRATAAGTWTSSASPTYMSFFTADDNTSSFTTFLTKKGTWSINGTENDTLTGLFANFTVGSINSLMDLQASGVSRFRVGKGFYSGVAATTNDIEINGNWSPTSGTGTYSQMRYTTTVNAASGVTGEVNIIDIRPTVTLTQGDFRAINIDYTHRIDNNKSDDVIRFVPRISSDVGVTATQWGIKGYTQILNGSSGQNSWFSNAINIQGYLEIASTDTSNNTIATGVYGSAELNSTGFINEIQGGRFGGRTSVAGGRVTNFYAVKALLEANAGTITNTYGFWAGDMTAGTQTNQAWSFYASDPNARNYFAGATGFNNTSPVAMVDITGASLTGSSTTGAVNVIQTWNTSGNPIALKVNVTNTASGGTAKLLALQTNSSNVFSVSPIGEVVASSTIQGNTLIATNTGNGLIINGVGRLKAPGGNGVWQLTNNNENDWGRLQFGGSTSAFPSIARNGTGLQVRLADNSGYGPLESGSFSVNGSPAASAAVTINSTTQGFLPPVMTATQGSAIGTPAQGLMIFVTTTNGTFTAIGWWGFDGTNWVQIG